MQTFSGRLRERDERWYIPLVRPQNFYFCFENNLFYGIYDICNSFSAYGQRSSLKADPGVFQRGVVSMGVQGKRPRVKRMRDVGALGLGLALCLNM